jgi:thiosulfate dehydrogenase [quinone] large subunit
MNATRARQGKVTLPSPPRGQDRAPGVSVLDSWRRQPISLQVLRAFLGATFLYAGVQKLSDPNFLHAGTPDFIGTQLQGFARGSPIGGLLRGLAQVPVFTGVGVAVTEIAIGIGTLVGIAPLLFAFFGFLVNLALTLSASWHVHPYFLGSDSIYAVAWAAYFLGTAEDARRARRAAGARRRPQGHSSEEIARREMLRGVLLAGLTLLTAGFSAVLAGTPARPRITSRAARSRNAASNPGAGSAARGTPIATLSQVPVGDAIGFNAPGVGPAALVRLGQDQVVAFSRLCTHAGCLVGYDPSTRLLVCPCHGAEFDPARRAEVVAGPAPRPLAPVQVEVDSSTGQVILPS